MSLLLHLHALEDTRKDINKEYELLDIVFLTLAAVLSGATGWKGIKLFGDAKLDWLRQYRPMTQGIPTRHTIGRIIGGIKAESLLGCFEQWVTSLRGDQSQEHIAFDGKVLRGSRHKAMGHKAMRQWVRPALMYYFAASSLALLNNTTMQA